MVDRNIISKLGLSEELMEQEIQLLFSDEHEKLLDKVLETKVEALIPGTIVKGKIVTQFGNDVIVELGLKSEGIVDASDFDSPDEIVPGKEIEVLLEEMDAESGIMLSKRKADRIRGWEHVITHHAEGDVIKGMVSRRIKGGLLVDIGVPVFLPASQVDIGKRVKGTVVNIMNYGAFIRLEDGIEGLVHISEMSWTKRIGHPSDILHTGDEIDVMVLDVNKEKQEISLGLKQLETDPWSIAGQKYPPGTMVDAKVTSLTNYGAFVEIEPGIDGLIHISDMSWTKKFNHPGEALQKGQEIRCVVLEVDEEKHRISLGIKQLSEDPWARAIPEKYIAGQIVHGKITKLTNFGVFVELEEDLEGLLHISELADHKIDAPQDIVKIGDDVEVKILRVDHDSRKIGLSLRRAQWAAEDKAAEDGQTRPQEPQESAAEQKQEAPRRGGLDGALMPDSLTFGKED